MKSFRFALQPLRVLREQKERFAQQRYADALRVCENAAGLVNAAGDELKKCWTHLTREVSAGANGGQMLRTRAWCNALEIRLRDRTRALEKARLAVDAVWTEMLTATRDREAMDRFHDKSRRTYDGNVQREEQRNLDEMAVQMAASVTPLHPQARR